MDRVQQVATALAAATVFAAAVVAAPESEEDSYQRCWKAFSQAEPEPEPPAGVLAPPGTDRHKRAVKKYAAALSAWEAREAERLRQLEATLSAHLAAHPKGRRTDAVHYLRGATRYRRGRFAEARPDLERFLKVAPAGPARDAAREALTACHRALGDYGAVLRTGIATPHGLEEAGRVEEAIAAATKAGLRKWAAAWRQIGRPFPPSRAPLDRQPRVILVRTAQNPPAAVLVRLQRTFSKEKFGIAVANRPETDIYLLDGNRLIQAVNPRLDTLEHRIRALLAKRPKQK